MESFRDHHKPKVVTYIKYINREDDIHQDVKGFAQELDTTLKHYYNLYDHIDTLKFQMLMQLLLHINSLGLDNSVLEVSNGKISLNGEVVASCEAIPMFTGNIEYATLKEEYRQVDADYIALKERFFKDGKNEQAEADYFKIASKRAKLKEQFETKEKELLEYVQEVAKKSGESDLTPRQMSGYRLVEQGKYQEALQMLDKDEIFWEIDRNLKEAEISKDALQKNVNELMQRVDVLMAQAITPEVIADIYETFEKAYANTLHQHLDKEMLYTYAGFLGDQKNYTKAIEVAKVYLYRCDDPSQKATEAEYAKIYNALSMLHYETNHMKEAEEYCVKSMRIREELCKENATECPLDLAISYNNLATLYFALKRIKEAEAYYIKTIEIKESLCTANPNMECSGLVSSYSNLARLYREIQRMPESEEYFVKAMNIQGKLCEANPGEGLFQLATIYNNIAILYRDTNCMKEAEDYFVKSSQMLEDLCKENPEAYMLNLAGSYNNLARLYRVLNRTNEAEEYCVKSIRMLEDLCKQTPEAAMPVLAGSYSNLAVLYCAISRTQEAQELLIKAIQIQEDLCKNNSNVYLPYLAGNYNNLAVLYCGINRIEEAGECSIKAIQMKEALYQTNPELYASDLANCYRTLAEIYRKANRPKEAAEYDKKAENLKK